MKMINFYISILFVSFFLVSCDNNSETGGTDQNGDISSDHNNVVKQTDKQNIEASSLPATAVEAFLEKQRLKYDPAILIVGVEGEKPIGFAKTCFENVWDNQRAYFQERFRPDVDPNQLAVMTSNPDLGNLFLCQISHHNYSVAVPVHEVANLIEIDGPGIYYLGTVNTTQQGMYKGDYSSKIPPAILAEISELIPKLREVYKGLELRTKNFDLDNLDDEGYVLTTNLGNAIEKRKQELENIKDEPDNKVAELDAVTPTIVSSKPSKTLN